MLKFSKGGKATAAEMHTDDLGLLDPEEAEEGGGPERESTRERATPRGVRRTEPFMNGDRNGGCRAVILFGIEWFVSVTIPFRMVS